MNKLSNNRLLALYALLAVGYWIFGISIMVGNYPGTLEQITRNNLWGIIYVTVLNFILFEYSIPFILRKRAYIIYNILLGIVILWTHMILYSYGSYLWRKVGMEITIYTQLKEFPTKSLLLQQQMAYSMGSVFFFGVIRHIYNYVRLSQAAQKLRLEKQGAELNYLKSQTNPHFLFNTLNNIYSLTKDKSDIAPESIMRLSKILRFMIYETSGKYISIDQEVRIINDYVELEKLRYDESLRVNFEHDIENPKQSMSPLLLITLVENAFKHGVSETTGKPFVDIKLSVRNKQLMFIVKNSTDESYEEKPVKENIGLTNLKRQLQLLYTNYELSVNQGQNVFTALLKINLASHVQNKVYSS
jgi:sensor histidine kinase YesM